MLKWTYGGRKQRFHFAVMVSVKEQHQIFDLYVWDRQDNHCSIIKDISEDRKFVHQLARDCTRWQVEPVHVRDVVEDRLAQINFDTKTL